jgi:hypothetical protein
MSNSSLIIVQCSDSPLAIAASVTGFVTTFVAVVLAHYGFSRVFVSAPHAFRLFEHDVRMFQELLDSITEDFELGAAERQEPNKVKERYTAYQARFMLEKARATVADAEKLLTKFGSPTKNMSNTNRWSLWFRVKLGIIWWWSLGDKTHELRYHIGAHRAEFSFL